MIRHCSWIHRAQRQFFFPLPNALLTLRTIHSTASLAAVKPFLLADIGEGIKEVQIIQWFINEGSRVEQFDKVCEVQSDKAVTEITSRYDGIIKKLHYERDDTAQVGKPLCDIDVEGDSDESGMTPTSKTARDPSVIEPLVSTPAKHGTLATPAVRGLLKALDIDIKQVEGTGKEGRVSKEDAQQYAASRNLSNSTLQTRSKIPDGGTQGESMVSMTAVQAQMFKTMTRSLSIPHFLYTDEVNLSALCALRSRLKLEPRPSRLTYLPFVIKAISMALHDFPLLNARMVHSDSVTQPRLMMREKHNIGVAMDTPQGLMVPNIKHVAGLSIMDIAEQLSELRDLARSAKLTARELTGGTITVSNIGSIGGTYVAPILVDTELAILGIGQAKEVPAFDEAGGIVKKTIGNFSWSADHRVIDGATMARMSERVKSLLEEPALMMTILR